VFLITDNHGRGKAAAIGYALGGLLDEAKGLIGKVKELLGIILTRKWP
jgi:hypothetical protein